MPTAEDLIKRFKNQFDGFETQPAPDPVRSAAGGKTETSAGGQGRDPVDVPGESSGKVTIELDNLIRIPSAGLPAGLLKDLEKSLIFRNPLYYRNQKYGRSNQGIEPQLKCIWPDPAAGRLLIPRGFMYGLSRLLHKHRVNFVINDGTNSSASQVEFRFDSSLYGFQAAAFKEVLKRRFCILVGPLGSGRKKISLKLAAVRKVPVLVIVRTKHQLYEWKESAGRFLGLAGNDIGLIGDGRRQLDKSFTVGISLSLYKVMDEIKSKKGFVIVDQADFANLKIFFKCVKPLDSPFMMGLAAGAKRKDGLTALLCAYLGRRVYLEQPNEFAGQGALRPVLKLHKTDFVYDYQEDFHEMITALATDEKRNQMITADVLQETATPGKRALVISQRVKHLEALGRLIRGAMSECEIISGATSEKKKKEICDRFTRGKLSILLVTLKSVPALEVNQIDCLIVATPLKIGDHLAQLVGKLMTAGQDARAASIIDYADSPDLLRVSLNYRLKVYRSMGVLPDASK